MISLHNFARRRNLAGTLCLLRFSCWVLAASFAFAAILATPSNARGQKEYQEFTPAEWRTQLGENEYAVIRRRAAYVLGRLKSTDKAADAVALAKALKDRDLVVRWYAADSLGRLGAAAKSAIPKMTAGLTDATNDKDVRRNLAKSLGRIGAANEDAIKQLEKDLAIEDALYAKAAAEALVSLGRPEAAYAKLLELARSKDEIVAFSALQSLLRLAENRAPQADEITPLLKHSNADVRRAAAKLIGQQGWSSVQPLLTELKGSDSATAYLAALRYATAKAPPDESSEVQKQLVAEAWKRVNADNGDGAIAQALLASQGVVTVASLWDAWPTGNPQWRAAAERTVDKWLRANATLTAQQIAPAASDLVEKLNAAVASEDDTTRRLGLWLLAELPLNPQAIDTMSVRNALRDADVFNRRNAASIIRRQAKAKTPN